MQSAVGVESWDHASMAINQPLSKALVHQTDSAAATVPEKAPAVSSLLTSAYENPGSAVGTALPTSPSADGTSHATAYHSPATKARLTSSRTASLNALRGLLSGASGPAAWPKERQSQCNMHSDLQQQQQQQQTREGDRVFDHHTGMSAAGGGAAHSLGKRPAGGNFAVRFWERHWQEYDADGCVHGFTVIECDPSRSDAISMTIMQQLMASPMWEDADGEDRFSELRLAVRRTHIEDVSSQSGGGQVSQVTVDTRLVHDNLLNWSSNLPPKVLAHPPGFPSMDPCRAPPGPSVGYKGPPIRCSNDLPPGSYTAPRSRVVSLLEEGQLSQEALEDARKVVEAGAARAEAITLAAGRQQHGSGCGQHGTSAALATASACSDPPKRLCKRPAEPLTAQATRLQAAVGTAVRAPKATIAVPQPTLQLQHPLNSLQLPLQMPEPGASSAPTPEPLLLLQENSPSPRLPERALQGPYQQGPAGGPSSPQEVRLPSAFETNSVGPIMGRIGSSTVIQGNDADNLAPGLSLLKCNSSMFLPPAPSCLPSGSPYGAGSGQLCASDIRNRAPSGTLGPCKQSSLALLSTMPSLLQLGSLAIAMASGELPFAPSATLGSELGMDVGRAPTLPGAVRDTEEPVKMEGKQEGAAIPMDRCVSHAPAPQRNLSQGPADGKLPYRAPYGNTSHGTAEGFLTVPYHHPKVAAPRRDLGPTPLQTLPAAVSTGAFPHLLQAALGPAPGPPKGPAVDIPHAHPAAGPVSVKYNEGLHCGPGSMAPSQGPSQGPADSFGCGSTEPLSDMEEDDDSDSDDDISSRRPKGRKGKKGGTKGRRSKGTKGQLNRRKKDVAHITTEFLEKGGYFDMPIQQAANHLEVGVTTLKKICRCNNVLRWPYRKRSSLDRLIDKTTQFISSTSVIATLPESVPKDRSLGGLGPPGGGPPDAGADMMLLDPGTLGLTAVETLQQQKQLLKENAAYTLPPDVLKLRQSMFKLEYQHNGPSCRRKKKGRAAKGGPAVVPLPISMLNTLAAFTSPSKSQQVRGDATLQARRAEGGEEGVGTADDSLDAPVTRARGAWTREGAGRQRSPTMSLSAGGSSSSAAGSRKTDNTGSEVQRLKMAATAQSKRRMQELLPRVHLPSGVREAAGVVEHERLRAQPEVAVEKVAGIQHKRLRVQPEVAVKEVDERPAGEGTS